MFLATLKMVTTSMVNTNAVDLAIKYWDDIVIQENKQ